MRRDTKPSLVSRGFRRITCLFRNAILTDVSVKELEPQGLNFCWNTHVSWGKKMSSWPRECKAFWKTLLSLIWRVSDATGLSGLPPCCRLAWDHTWPWGLGAGDGGRDTCLSLSHIYTHTFLGLGTFFPHKDMFYDYTCIFMTKQSHIRLRGSGVWVAWETGHLASARPALPHSSAHLQGKCCWEGEVGKTPPLQVGLSMRPTSQPCCERVS